MSKLSQFFEDYLFITAVGFLMGVLFVIKGYEKAHISTKMAHARYVISGVLGSMFITWVGFELFLFAGLPSRLSVALGGLLAYLGADKIADIFELLIQKKLGLNKCEHERESK